MGCTSRYEFRIGGVCCPYASGVEVPRQFIQLLVVSLTQVPLDFDVILSFEASFMWFMTFLSFLVFILSNKGYV